jgi:hypothetical protein
MSDSIDNSYQSTARFVAVNDRDEKGRFKQGNKPSTGFHSHPERRSNGSWNKSATARAKLEKLMTYTENELVELKDDIKASMFERKLAESIINSTWTTIDAMITQVYGKAKESVDITDKSNSAPLIKGYVIPTLPKNFVQLDNKED